MQQVAKEVEAIIKGASDMAENLLPGQKFSGKGTQRSVRSDWLNQSVREVLRMIRSHVHGSSRTSMRWYAHVSTASPMQ